MSVKTLMSHVKQGRLRFINIGTQTRKVDRFTPKNLQTFIENQKIRETPKCQSISAPPLKPNSYDFWSRGQRFHGDAEVRTKREAQAVELRLKAKAKADLEEAKRTGNGPLLLRYAAGRYWKEVGKDHRDSEATKRNLAWIIEYFGPDRRLDEIRDAEVSALIAWRRAQTLKGRKGAKPVSDSTINRSTTEVLRKLFTRARKAWGYQFREPN